MHTPGDLRVRMLMGVQRNEADNAAVSAYPRTASSETHEFHNPLYTYADLGSSTTTLVHGEGDDNDESAIYSTIDHRDPRRAQVPRQGIAMDNHIDLHSGVDSRQAYS